MNQAPRMPTTSSKLSLPRMWPYIRPAAAEDEAGEQERSEARLLLLVRSAMRCCMR